MNLRRFSFILFLGVLLGVTGSVFVAQGEFLIGDPLPYAPELSPRGEYGVGVRTIEAVNPDQLNILEYSEDNTNPRYDRELTLEVWYPAQIPENRKELTHYTDYQHVEEPISYKGRALRGAEPVEGQSFPLLVVSHGYPGTRLMMSYLAENMASKGYVVASIQHPDSTVINQKDFSSTLLNRPLDILFTVDEMAKLGKDGSGSFLSGLVNADMTGLIGYSMGGYGSINAAGAGFSEQGVKLPWGVPGGKLEKRQAGNKEFKESMDERIKAIYVMSPWGATEFWNEETMKGLDVPSFFVAGNEDDVAGYENGIKKFFEWAENSNRYMLVARNARHNIAPNAYGVNPLPSKEMNSGDYMRYGEPAWDNRYLNNLMQHFATAFFGTQLKDKDYGEYLDLIQVSNEGKWSLKEDGTPAEDHTHWKGFPKRTAVGLEFYHKEGK
jgi:predicted dienelactone hydrolase